MAILKKVAVLSFRRRLSLEKRCLGITMENRKERRGLDNRIRLIISKRRNIERRMKMRKIKSGTRKRRNKNKIKRKTQIMVKVNKRRKRKNINKMYMRKSQIKMKINKRRKGRN